MVLSTVTASVFIEEKIWPREFLFYFWARGGGQSGGPPKCSRITSPVLVMGLFCIRAATAMLEIEVEHGAMSTLTIYYRKIPIISPPDS